ncbi:hypothetical protein A4X13_0g1177 [Tilletia indica]|uniref:Sugar phosphate transporter domain-containing protein n=1 Tax=Tilletia indica TaxID=43049 RepID=A0A177TRQ4_9BASI|nr:hypothetical protein A4X13_0g1177 [Tilletia indica]
MLPSPSTHSRRAGVDSSSNNTWATVASSWLSSVRTRNPAHSPAANGWRSGFGGGGFNYAPVRDQDADRHHGKDAHGSSSSAGAVAGGGAGRVGRGSGGEWSIERRSAILLVATCVLWYLTSAMNNNTSQALLKSKASHPAHPSTGSIVPPNLDTHHAQAHDTTGSTAAAVAKTPPIFPYPVTLTLSQFVFVNVGVHLCCSPTLLGRHRLGTLIRPTWSKVRQVGQLSVFSVVGHLFASAAISRVPVSTVQTIKALSPLFTVIAYSSLFNVSYPFKTYFSLLPLTFGVMLACTGFNLSGDDLLGFSAALASTLVLVAQNIYSKKLLGGAGGQGEGKMDKLNILYVSSATSIVLLLPSFLLQEVPKLMRGRITDSAVPSSQSFQVVYLLVVNGIAHFAQNVFAFSVLGLVSPVTYSIASLFKRVFVIIVAIIWFGQAVTLLQWIGIAFTFGGLYLYNDSKPGKVDEKVQRRERQQQLHLPLPNERQQAESDLRAASPGLRPHSHTSYPPSSALLPTINASTYPLSPPPLNLPKHDKEEGSILKVSLPSQTNGDAKGVLEGERSGQAGGMLPITPPDSSAGAPDSEEE